MARGERASEPTAPSKCTVCDTYDFKGTWRCQCDAVNVGKNESCWKCKAPRSRSK